MPMATPEVAVSHVVLSCNPRTDLYVNKIHPEDVKGEAHVLKVH